MIPFCSTCQFTMTVPADPSAIPALTDGVTQVLQEKHWNDKDVMAVELALQEAVANAIRHGCGGDTTQGTAMLGHVRRGRRGRHHRPRSR